MRWKRKNKRKRSETRSRRAVQQTRLEHTFPRYIFLNADLFRSAPLLGPGKQGHVGAVLLYDVVPQLVRPGEALRALGARERPFARVRAVVPLQVRQPEERQVAVRALVRLQAGVRLHVPSQVLLVEERALARGTFDRGGAAAAAAAVRHRSVVHLERLVLGLRQHGRAAPVMLAARVLLHHHLRAEHVGVLETRRVVVRRVVLARHAIRFRGASAVGLRKQIAKKKKSLNEARFFAREIAVEAGGRGEAV